MGLEDIEEIKQLKYAYFRLLDLKQFVELGQLLTDGCTASYEDGKNTLEGRAAIVGFLDTSLSDPRLVSAHFGHHPEITLTSQTSATGVWYLEDRVMALDFDLEIGGTAFYSDEYTKVEGEWRISHTGYKRVFEERRVHSTLEVKSVVTRF
jgi:hypothetical protein